MEMYENGYTVKEERLIRQFGYSHLIPMVDSPPSLYDMCAQKAFINDMKGPHVEALRRACKALSECHPYRMTEEFEQLIEF